MTQNQLRRSAEARLPGVEIRPHHVASAIRAGFIQPTKAGDGWFLYSDDAVDALADYMRTHSRTARQSGSLANA